MSKSGPKKVPLKILKNRGSWLAKTRTDIQTDTAIIKRPRGLDKYAKKFWDKTIPGLLKLGILASIDWSKLDDLCELYSRKERYKEAAAYPVIKRTNEKTGKITFEDNKMYYAWRSAVKDFNKLAAEFCIGPTNRAGMGEIQDKEKSNEKSKFFRKNG